MSKLCFVYNAAQHYRTAIFMAMDAKYDCDWYFGKTTNDIKEMDLSKLKHTYYYTSVGNPSKLYWQKGLISLLFKTKYQNYFILTQARSVSVWVMVLLKSIFFPKKKLYGWSHGWYGREGKVRQLFDRWRIKQMSGQFVYSEYSRNLMIAGGIPEDKVFVIANSLDYDKQLELRNGIKCNPIYKNHFGNDFSNLVFIGRLTKSKKLDLLIKAVAQLKKEGFNLNITFIGDGECKNELLNLSNALNIEENTWFYGACYDEKENADLIYNADLCVSPGNVGLTAIHSMSFGTPVITHNDFRWQGPEFEAIHPGITGDFFQIGDVNSLAKTIKRWFSAHEFRDKVRQACYKEIDHKWTPYFQMDQLNKHLILR